MVSFQGRAYTFSDKAHPVRPQSEPDTELVYSLWGFEINQERIHTMHGTLFIKPCLLPNPTSEIPTFRSQEAPDNFLVLMTLSLDKSNPMHLAGICAWRICIDRESPVLADPDPWNIFADVNVPWSPNGVESGMLCYMIHHRFARNRERIESTFLSSHAEVACLDPL